MGLHCRDRCRDGGVASQSRWKKEGGAIDLDDKEEVASDKKITARLLEDREIVLKRALRCNSTSKVLA